MGVSVEGDLLFLFVSLQVFVTVVVGGFVVIGCLRGLFSVLTYSVFNFGLWFNCCAICFG